MMTLFYECELILQFVKLVLNLEKIEMCVIETDTRCQCNDSDSLNESQNDNHCDNNFDNNSSESPIPVSYSIPLTSCSDSWNWIPSVINDNMCE